MGFRIVTAPTVLPVTIEDCRNHLHWDVAGDTVSEGEVDAAEDQLILDKLGAACEYAEDITGLWLRVQTVEYTFERWPTCRFIEVPGAPVRSVESIEYLDENGDSQDLDPTLWTYDAYSTPKRVYIAYRTSWPEARCDVNSIRVRAIVGYGTIIGDTPQDVLALPYKLKAALLLTMAHLLENKEDSAPIALASIPTGTLDLLQQSRINLGV